VRRDVKKDARRRASTAMAIIFGISWLMWMAHGLSRYRGPALLDYRLLQEGGSECEPRD
jgi:hypothetical protein